MRTMTDKAKLNEPLEKAVFHRESIDCFRDVLFPSLLYIQSIM